MVALVHGFVGDALSTWSGQLEGLSDEFTVIAWDAPGSGASSDVPEHVGMDGYADCLADFLKAVGVERAHLVGLSFGAAVVLATFHRHRGIALSLSLISGYAGWSGSLGPEAAQARLLRSLTASRLSAEDFVAVMAPSTFSPQARGDLVAGFLANVGRFRPAGFRAMARASHTDLSHVLAEVDIPTLLIYADQDVRAPVWIGEAIHRAIPRSQIVVLEGPGHVSPVEAPADVTRELRQFFRSVDRSPPADHRPLPPGSS